MQPAQKDSTWLFQKTNNPRRKRRNQATCLADAERIRKLAEQAELEALKERCTKACSQAAQSNAVTVLRANNVKLQTGTTEAEQERVAPVVGGSHFLELEVGGLRVKAYLDTGSPATIISEELLDL